MSHGVMPFDMNKTVHVFRMTESGGFQSVIVKDRNDAGQIKLIRQDPREETGRFQRTQRESTQAHRTPGHANDSGFIAHGLIVDPVAITDSSGFIRTGR